MSMFAPTATLEPQHVDTPASDQHDGVDQHLLSPAPTKKQPKTTREKWLPKYERHLGLRPVTDASGQVVEAHCKFCEAFGREATTAQDSTLNNEKGRKRKPTKNVKVFKMFRRDNMVAHLSRAHTQKWEEYQHVLLNNGDWEAFFGAKRARTDDQSCLPPTDLSMITMADGGMQPPHLSTIMPRPLAPVTSAATRMTHNRPPMRPPLAHKMKYRFLGKSGLLVSQLSLGSWITFDTQLDFERAYLLMEHAYRHGINFFDNAEVYANGQSEVLMGQVIKSGIEFGVWKRENLVISTKIFFGTMEGPNANGLSRKHIVEGVKAALKRFDLEYVDLILCHRPDPYTPMEEIVRAMNFVIGKGWAFYWGTSEWSAADISEACEVAERLGLIRPVFEQPQYNMLERSKVDYDYVSLYKKYKYGLTTWSPLESGILTGKYSKGIPAGSRLSLPQYRTMLSVGLNEKVAKVDQLAVIANDLSCSLAQLSIAWCLSNPNVSSVILGATSVTQLDENLRAMEVVDKLTPEIKARIDQIVQFYPKVIDQAQDHVHNLRTKYL